MKPYISVEHAGITLGGREILKDVNMRFNKGMIGGIIGRNGSGKTVLLKSIIGILKLDHGEIHVDGKKIGVDTDFAQSVGFIVNEPGFLPNCSARKNLRYLAAIQGKANDEKINETIRMVGLDPEDKKHVGKYSMGMKQRLGIAQALMESPEILIFDEPMNGLDNSGVKSMRALFKKLQNEGRTLIITSHNHEDIEQLCEVVYEMDGGKIIASAS